MKKSYIQQEAEQVRLSVDEKEHIRAHFQILVRHAPLVRKSAAQRYNRYTVPVRASLLHNLFMRPMAITLILAILLGGGASFAAESALPGDIFYPVKIEMNERVRAWVAVSDEAKAEWQTRVVERRLEEAEKLASENRLTAETRTSLEARFESNAQDVEKRIDDFQAEEKFDAAVDASSNFETTLRTHVAILEHLNIATDTKSKAQAEIEPLIIKVRARVGDASKTRQEHETRIATSTGVQVKVAAEGRLRAAEQKVAEVTKFIEQSSAGVDVKASAKTQLEVAMTTIASGKAKMELEAYHEAFILFQEASRIAQEAHLLLQARMRLPIDIQFNIRTRGTLESRDNEETSTHIDAEASTDIHTDTTINDDTELETSDSAHIEIGL